MVDSEDSTCVDLSSAVLLTSFSKVRMMSTRRRMTTSPANAPNAAASRGNGNSDAGALSPGEVTETDVRPERTGGEEAAERTAV